MPVLLLACFFVSGATGLLLELCWVRQLGHVFGGETLAISTVLSTFMGGLALGSWLGGRRADRLRIDPLVAYAACELGIAACALLIPAALRAYPAGNALLWRTLEGSPAALALARFGLCAILLLPPTTLMGATLPLLSRRVIRAGDEVGLVGPRVGALYAANTAGAVVGVGLTGFWLLPLLGVRRTTFVAVIADAALAAAALVLARHLRRREAALAELDALAGAVAVGPAPEEVAVAEPAPPPSRTAARAAAGAFAVSGAVAMILEVLWSRALALVIGSSIYSFTLVLLVFLVGLSAGAAWIGRPAARTRDPVGALALALLAIAGAVALVHRVIDDLPALFLALLEGSTIEVGWVMGVQALVAAVTVAPAAAALGAVMPLAVRAYAGSVDAVGRDVGRAYAANTVGAIVGSFAGGFVILPLVGLERGIQAAALVEVALAAFLALRAASRRLRLVTLALAPVPIAAVLLAPAWDLASLTSGVFRLTVAKRFIGAGRVFRPELLYHRDGTSTTVTVERHGDRLALKNNGKVEASSVADMPTQILVGLLPVVLHGGSALDVAVVGYGSGVTVGAIAEAPAVDRVDVVEIERAVYDAADRYFGPFNHHAHENPKVHRHVGDGRNFLTARAHRYDVIVSEPSNPWIAGVASLFSREFYAFARGHLAQGGVFCQWAQLYELGPRNVKTIYRTFSEAFPFVYAFSAADLSADTILVGSDRPLDLAPDALRARLGDARLAAELGRGGVSTAEDLIAMLILGPRELPAFAAGGDVNTDDDARLEFSAPRDLLAAGRGGRFADAIYGDLWPYGHLDDLLELDAVAAGKLGRALLAHGKRREAAVWAARAGETAEATRLLALLRLARTRDFRDPELPITAGGPPLREPTAAAFVEPGPARAGDLARLGEARLAIAETRWEDAWKLLSALPLTADSPAGRDVRLLYGYVLYKTLRLDQAWNVLEPLAQDHGFVRERPALLYYLGRIRYGDGAFADGADLLARFADEHAALIDQLD